MQNGNITGTDRSGSRIAWIDAARGIAIILVVLGHAIHMVARGGGAPMPGWLQHLDRIIYTFHVPVFLFLAGLFLPTACQNTDRPTWVARRTIALLYPYLIWATVQTTLELLAAGSTLPEALRSYARVLYFPPAHFWFVYVLFFCSALLVFLPGVAARDARHRWLPLCVALGAYALHPYLPGGPLRDMSRSLIIIVAGCLCAPWMRLRPRTATLVIVASALCFLPVAARCTIGDGTPHPATGLLLALGGIAFTVVLASCTRGWFSRALSYLGSHSLAVYLLHVMAIQASLILLQRALPRLTGVPLVLGVTLLGTLLPVIALLLMRRLRLDRKLGLC